MKISSTQYQILNSLPKLKFAVDDLGEEMLSSFLAWAEEQKLTMGWSIHIHLLRWLHLNQKWKVVLTTEICKECLAASIKEWSWQGLEHPSAQGLLIYSKLIFPLAIGFWKNKNLEETSKIVSIKLPASLQFETDRYAISYQHGQWENARWFAIPL